METPKEKAISIVDKYRKVKLLSDFDGMDEQLAIECAKIEVREILNIISYHGKDIGDEYSLFQWKIIQDELHKL